MLVLLIHFQSLNVLCRKDELRVPFYFFVDHENLMFSWHHDVIDIPVDFCFMLIDLPPILSVPLALLAITITSLRNVFFIGGNAKYDFLQTEPFARDTLTTHM